MVEPKTTSTPGIEDQTSNDDPVSNQQEPKVDKGLRFWLVFLGLCLAGFVASMDATIIFTALPTISDDVNGQKEYIWLANAYVITSTAIQPLYGQLSNIFGRRNPMIASVLLFALGSGIAGGASNAATFVSGRLVQGLGAGGMVMLIDLIVCDLLPLRERSQYLGAVLGACAVGTLIGPVLGGAIVTHATWRWAFWINLPMCVITLAIMVPFLRLSWKTSPSWAHAVSRIDFVGNFIFIGAITSMLLGLVQGGVLHPWNSWKIILPLVVGVVGWAVFFLQQSYCSEPTMPLHLFAHRTSASVYVQNFVVSILLQWTIFVLPLYFQSQLGASALVSGINILPLNAVMIPSGAIAGMLLTKLGRYKPLHWVGFAILAISCGLFSIMTPTTNTAAWACFQLLAGIGIGFPLTTQLPAIQAVLPEADTAVSTSTYSFIRSFGFIWGATIPSIIFNSCVNDMLGRISDPDIQAAMIDGGAYSYALHVKDLQGVERTNTLYVYHEALRTVWFVGVAFALLGFVLVFFEKHVEMRTTLETSFGLEKEDEEENAEGLHRAEIRV